MNNIYNIYFYLRKDFFYRENTEGLSLCMEKFNKMMQVSWKTKMVVTILDLMMYILSQGLLLGNTLKN